MIVFPYYFYRPPEIIDDIYPYVQKCRSAFSANPSQLPLHDDSFINTNDSANFDDSLGNIVNIIVSYDMGWSKRGNGRSYDSLNGYGAIISLVEKFLISPLVIVNVKSAIWVTQALTMIVGKISEEVLRQWKLT